MFRAYPAEDSAFEVGSEIGCLGLEHRELRNSDVCFVGTQTGHKHKHFIGISLPYWASLSKGGCTQISMQGVLQGLGMGRSGFA